MFLDLDEFKEVNDTLGHKKGDQLLKVVASNLEAVVSDNGVVARFGGDEFMILLRNYDNKDTVVNMAESIINIFKTNQTIGYQNFNITASIGISIFPNDGEDSDTLIKNADIAMYVAKEGGKNNYFFCNDKLKADVALDFQLTSDLRSALDNNEFVVHYQPQIDLQTNKIEGVEALLRWNHPSRGLIPPSIFIPLAEKSDLINDIGEWVFKEACLLCKKWQDLGLPDIEVAVNLSTVQIINPNLGQSIAAIIEKTKVDPKYIVLEITESAAIKETKYVVSVLNKLKSLGLSIAVDDFGTEYSSLSRLKQLPIDQIKIDLQFIQGIETNNKDRAIIKVIIKLAKSLGLSVLAEGIENSNQLQFLTENDCDYGQGYYFYRPMPANEVTRILKDNLIKAEQC
ncbi:MAG TPA: bifunctional diguanylate cyclase/phosphodiesterase [Erysipelotrichaceae bacterium]|nr:bifunctional diguanylate cyclase/phosphodiesterase [Erysipelotrichaceae bacterium]